MAAKQRQTERNFAVRVVNSVSSRKKEYIRLRAASRISIDNRTISRDNSVGSTTSLVTASSRGIESNACVTGPID
ncbi:hypothetical protein TMatcc_009287 [Talaromyces marneffei ATCC 18224]